MAIARNQPDAGSTGKQISMGSVDRHLGGVVQRDVGWRFIIFDNQVYRSGEVVRTGTFSHLPGNQRCALIAERGHVLGAADGTPADHDDTVGLELQAVAE